MIEIHYDSQGLIPAIVQDARTKAVLMMAYMNRASLERTLQSGETVFWSRSRGEFWHKGESSGNTQRVISLSADCDGDTLLVLVEPRGPACHTGAVSCFFNELEKAATVSSQHVTRTESRAPSGDSLSCDR